MFTGRGNRKGKGPEWAVFIHLTVELGGLCGWSREVWEGARQEAVEAVLRCVGFLLCGERPARVFDVREPLPEETLRLRLASEQE